MRKLPFLSLLFAFTLSLFWGCNITNEHEKSNLPPEIVSSISDQVIFKGDNFAPIYLLEHISDPDGESKNIEWSFSSSSELQVIQAMNAEDIIIVVPENPDWTGTEEITITAKDEAGKISSFTVSFTLKTFSGSTVPLEKWVHVKDSMITAYPKYSATPENTTIDTVYDTTVTVVSDTTMILETTEDSVIIWKKSGTVMEKLSCDYKVAYEKGYLLDVTEKDVEDLLLSSVESIFDTSSVDTDVEDSGEVVSVYFANAYTPYIKPVDEYLEVKYGGFILYAGINMTVRNYAIYQKYTGEIPSTTLPQTIIKVD